MTVFGLLVGGCASTEKKINTVSVGMDKQQVIDALGPPESSRANKSVEYLIYNLTKTRNADDALLCTIGSVMIVGAAMCKRSKAEYFVQFQQGKVTAYGKVGDFDSTQDPEATINLNQTVKEVE